MILVLNVSKNRAIINSKRYRFHINCKWFYDPSLYTRDKVARKSASTLPIFFLDVPSVPSLLAQYSYMYQRPFFFPRMVGSVSF